MSKRRAAGVKQFGLYDYGGYLKPGAPLFWYLPIVDRLEVLHEDWGYRHGIGEMDNTHPKSQIPNNKLQTNYKF